VFATIRVSKGAGHQNLGDNFCQILSSATTFTPFAKYSKVLRYLWVMDLKKQKIIFLLVSYVDFDNLYPLILEYRKRVPEADVLIFFADWDLVKIETPLLKAIVKTHPVKIFCISDLMRNHVLRFLLRSPERVQRILSDYRVKKLINMITNDNFGRMLSEFPIKLSILRKMLLRSILGRKIFPVLLTERDFDRWIETNRVELMIITATFEHGGGEIAEVRRSPRRARAMMVRKYWERYGTRAIMVDDSYQCIYRTQATMWMDTGGEWIRDVLYKRIIGHEAMRIFQSAVVYDVEKDITVGGNVRFSRTWVRHINTLAKKQCSTEVELNSENKTIVYLSPKLKPGFDKKSYNEESNQAVAALLDVFPEINLIVKGHSKGKLIFEKDLIRKFRHRVRLIGQNQLDTSCVIQNADIVITTPSSFAMHPLLMEIPVVMLCHFLPAPETCATDTIFTDDVVFKIHDLKELPAVFGAVLNGDRKSESDIELFYKKFMLGGRDEEGMIKQYIRNMSIEK